MKLSRNQPVEAKVTETGALIRLVSIGSIFILMIIMMMMGFLAGCSADGSVSSSVSFNFPGSGGFPVDTSLEWAFPEDVGWSSEELQDAHAYAIQSNCQAVLALYDGKVFFSRGNIHKNYPVGSLRESMLSALYGIQVERGNISLNATLEDLNLDDLAPGLTAAEKQAEVDHLLKSRSGVYHEAADEDQVMIDTRPDRESHAPDTFFYYNNWDINALGTIFEQEVGREICDVFDEEIAAAVGMVDFSIETCRYDYDWEKSYHPAFQFTMSARDLVKFGVLYQKNGLWKGTRVIQSDWVDDSTMAYSTMDETTGVGYGYLWKTFAEESALGQMIGYSGYYHTGEGGDVLLVIPDLKLVIVERYAGQVDWDEPDAASFELTQVILDARLPE